jgi:hypothetical protein
VVCVRLPDTPVTVTVADPTVAVPEAVSVSTLVPVVLDRLNDAVTPLGNPLADKFTAPVKPFVGETVIVLTLAAPCNTLTLLGPADNV